MENFDSKSNIEQDEKTVDLCPGTKSFKTDRGSNYEKLPDGTFQRHKYDGTEYEPFEWTIFTDKEGDTELRMARLKLEMMGITKKIIYFEIVEFNTEGNPINRAKHRNEVLDPNNDFDLLTIEADGFNEPKAILQTPITFKPKIGYTVFEFNSDNMEYHLGDQVSRIERMENESQ